MGIDFMIENLMYFHIRKLNETQFELIHMSKVMFIQHSHLNTLKIFWPKVKIFQIPHFPQKNRFFGQKMTLITWTQMDDFKYLFFLDVYSFKRKVSLRNRKIEKMLVQNDGGLSDRFRGGVSVD